MNLITDRTEQDVAYASQLRARVAAGVATAAERQLIESAALKGTYDAADLNRVEAAVRQLAGAMLSAGYGLAPPAVKTDWQTGDIPSAAQLERYLQNVRGLAVFGGPPLPRSMQNLNWQGANEIESALSAAAGHLENLTATLRNCGDLYTGEI